MSLPGLLRDRNSGIRQARLENYGRNRFLQEYRSYHADCVRIDAEALPAGLAFHPTAPQDVLLVADDKGRTVLFLDLKSMISKLKISKRHRWDHKHRHRGQQRAWSSSSSMAAAQICDFRREVDLRRLWNSHLVR